MMLLGLLLSLATANDSLFQIEGLWRTSQGKTVPLRALVGRPTLLAMVYLGCNYLCPTVISEVKSVESKLSPEQQKRLQVVLVSFDPERDTLSVMKKTSMKRDFPSSWTIITSDKESVLRTLTNALEFRFRKESDGEFTHSFLIAVLDAKGVLRARVDKTNQDKKVLVSALESRL